MEENQVITLPAENQSAGGLALQVSLKELMARRKVITEVMDQYMKPKIHYGLIPGCGKKPSLLKPGAEVLCSVFGLHPKYQKEIINLERGHREYVITCDLYNHNEMFLGSGLGSCSTMESKYRWRNASRVCPQCGNEAIIKGKEEYGGGWLCYKNKGGCGAKFKESDPAIVDQITGKVENEDPSDQYNTCLKMAAKRAQVAVVITVTGVSDRFTQDMEDILPVDESETVDRDTGEVIPPKGQNKKKQDAPPKTDPEKARKMALWNAIKPILEEVNIKLAETGLDLLDNHEHYSNAVLDFITANSETYESTAADIKENKSGWVNLFVAFRKQKAQQASAA